MDSPKTDIDLIELVIIDAIFNLIFILMLFVSILCPARHPFPIDLALIFGGITLQFAPVFGKWLNYLRYQENIKFAAMMKMDLFSDNWMFFDIGQKGYTWMFRLISVAIMVSSLYHLFRYMFG